MSLLFGVLLVLACYYTMLIGKIQGTILFKYEERSIHTQRSSTRGDPTIRRSCMRSMPYIVGAPLVDGRGFTNPTPLYVFKKYCPQGMPHIRQHGEFHSHVR